jgi:hypothetical protein
MRRVGAGVRGKVESRNKSFIKMTCPWAGVEPASST